ncbi:MAG: hypothetical protein AAFR16_14250 [Pseudomonadota bacterium]
MFTLIGAVVGFVAMLVARGRAGIAAGLAVLGLVLGMGVSAVFTIEVAIDFFRQFQADPTAANFDLGPFQISQILAGVMAALPGVLGALFARRD